MSKSNEDELREVLKETAMEISRMYDNPRSWLSWMTYLLERLEEQANHRNPANIETFKEMLSALQDELRNRLRTGGW
jgi:formate dehydrogenase maturation protein FdhE